MRAKRVLLVSCAAAALLGVGRAALATDLLTLEVKVVPFHWTVGGQTYSNEESYRIDGTEVPTSLNYEGTTYIPLRLLAEQLGQSVEWDDATKTALLTDAGAIDDPMADLPAPPASTGYRLTTTMVKGDQLRDNPGDSAQMLASLDAGTLLQVIRETNGYLQVRLNNGGVGYVPLASTDYIPEAQRPAWEQKADSIIALGLSLSGTPYQFGAKLGQTTTFDCSSFTSFVYGANGIKLPRDSRQQSGAGTEVNVQDIRKGDLLFFTTPARKTKSGLDRIGHVAIYLGNGQLLHTYRVGIGVTVTDLNSSWRSRLIKAERVLS